MNSVVNLPLIYEYSAIQTYINAYIHAYILKHFLKSTHFFIYNNPHIYIYALHIYLYVSQT